MYIDIIEIKMDKYTEQGMVMKNVTANRRQYSLLFNRLGHWVSNLDFDRANVKGHCVLHPHDLKLHLRVNVKNTLDSNL